MRCPSTCSDREAIVFRHPRKIPLTCSDWEMPNGHLSKKIFSYFSTVNFGVKIKPLIENFFGTQTSKFPSTCSQREKANAPLTGKKIPRSADDRAGIHCNLRQNVLNYILGLYTNRSQWRATKKHQSVMNRCKQLLAFPLFGLPDRLCPPTLRLNSLRSVIESKFF